MVMGDDNGNRTDQSQEALLKLVNYLYDTPEEKLPMLTRIERRAVLPLSIMMMKEAILDPERKAKGIPLSKVWRNSYFQLQRSVDRWFFMMGVGLAHEQVGAEQEQSSEDIDMI